MAVGIITDLNDILITRRNSYHLIPDVDAINLFSHLSVIDFSLYTLNRYGDQIVAIKVLNRGSTPEEKATLEARFIREVNMMCKVKHENLVKVLTGLNDMLVWIDVSSLFVPSHKSLYILQFIGACKEPLMVIVSELLPGMSLKNYLNSIRPSQLDTHTAISYALDIAHAMDCLHANGIIHRDLKPGKDA